MGWLSVVATGLAVRGATRRRQLRAEELERARELDAIRRMHEEALRGVEVWPPEDPEER